MLATPEDEVTGTMSFASLTDVVAVVMKQWSVQHVCSLFKRFFKNGDTVVKMQRIF
jgi:hypothetical protein